MGEIYLIRHGQASFGARNYDQLSETGVVQSRVLGDWLRAQEIRFDAVYAGERVRQQDTARLALEALPSDIGEPAIDPAFNELDADRLMHHAIPRLVIREPRIGPMLLDIGRNRDTFRRLFERVIDEWVSGEWQQAGIGDWLSFRERVVSGVRSLAARHEEGSRIAVFTSGGPITAVLQSLGHHHESKLDWRIANTSITRLQVDADGELQLLECRVVPHLEARPELLTHL